MNADANKGGEFSLTRMPPSKGIWIAAIFTIAAGAAEVVTGFRHEFFGIRTSSQRLFTYSSALIGFCYAAAGVLILTGARRAAAIALALLAVDFVGRVALVGTGLYPLGSARNEFGIVVGTALVAVVAAYVWRQFFGTRRG